MSSVDPTDPAYDIAVAIVGMAGRFPGAGSVDELWKNVVGGVRSIGPLDDDELRAAGVSDDELRDPDYVKAGAPLAGIDEFDAGVLRLSAARGRGDGPAASRCSSNAPGTRSSTPATTPPSQPRPRSASSPGWARSSVPRLHIWLQPRGDVVDAAEHCN